MKFSVELNSAPKQNMRFSSSLHIHTYSYDIQYYIQRFVFYCFFFFLSSDFQSNNSIIQICLKSSCRISSLLTILEPLCLLSLFWYYLKNKQLINSFFVVYSSQWFHLGKIFNEAYSKEMIRSQNKIYIFSRYFRIMSGFDKLKIQWWY